jgi:hypothetical protein
MFILSKSKFSLVSLILFLLLPVVALEQGGTFQVNKIWDHAGHNAFTDLIRYEGKFYCTFREAASHIIYPEGIDGKIRLLVSEDGIKWSPFALLSMKDIDLRDPKLSITPDGRMMLLVGATDFDKTQYKKVHSSSTYVAFLDPETQKLTPLQRVSIEKSVNSNFQWVWRVRWYKGWGYGVSYGQNDKGEPTAILLKTRDGLNYSLVNKFEEGSQITECDIAFRSDGQMVIIARRDGPDSTINGLIGRANIPYDKIEWTETEKIGGPAIIRYTNDQFVVIARTYKYPKGHTTVNLLGPGNILECVTELPSHRDNAYAGMVFYENKLWASYYSTHEGKTSVYLAQIPLSYIEHCTW